MKGGYKTLRATIEEAADHTKLDETTRRITYRDQEISLFYFRQGYVPKHYTSEACWKLR